MPEISYTEKDYQAMTSIGLCQQLGTSTPLEHQCRLKGPGVLIPLGTSQSVTGFKYRHDSPKLHFDNPSWFARSHGSRYSRYFHPDQMVSPVTQAKSLMQIPGWFSLSTNPKEIYVFEGELKAMAFDHFFHKDVISMGGISYHETLGLAQSLKDLEGVERIIICLDNDNKHKYRMKRKDNLSDSRFRGFQLATMLLDDPRLEVLLAEGLTTEQGVKVDLDEALCLSSKDSELILSNFSKTIDNARPALEVITAGGKLDWIRHSISTSNRFYALLKERYQLESKYEPNHPAWINWHRDVLKAYENSIYT